MSFSCVTGILLFALTLCIIDTVFVFTRKLVVANVARGAYCEVHGSVADGVGHVPVGCFRSEACNRMLSHVAGSISALKRDLGRDVARVVASITALINALIVVLSVSPLVALVSLIVLPISVVLVSFIVGRSRGCFERRRRCLKRVGKRIRRICKNRLIVGTCGGRTRAMGAFGRTGGILCGST